MEKRRIGMELYVFGNSTSIMYRQLTYGNIIETTKETVGEGMNQT